MREHDVTALSAAATAYRRSFLKLKFPSFIGGWCGDAGKRVRGPAWCRGLPGLLGFVW